MFDHYVLYLGQPILNPDGSYYRFQPPPKIIQTPATSSGQPNMAPPITPQQMPPQHAQQYLQPPQPNYQPIVSPEPKYTPGVGSMQGLDE